MNLLLLLAALALAQPSPSGPVAEPYQPGPGDGPAGMPGAEGPGGGPNGGGGEPAPKEEVYAPPQLNDAKANFPTIVESFLAQNTKDGVYQLRDKKAKRVRKLVFESIDEKSIRPKLGKDGLYSGTVRFKEAVTELPVTLEMMVDMSTPQWRVAGAKMRRQK